MRPQPTSYPAFESRECTEGDCHWLSKRLTEATEEEIKATSRYQTLTDLLSDHRSKRVIYDTRCRNQPVAILYVHPFPNGTAGFWLGWTDKLAESEHGWAFVTYLSPLIDHFNHLYPTLVCAVDVRDTRRSALMEQLGFKLAETIPQYGLKDLPFHLFKRTKAPSYV